MPVPPSEVEKLLLVEGPDDEHVICHLYQRAGLTVDFGVKAKGSVERVVRSIRNEALAPGRTALGIVVDANDKLPIRWQNISDELGRAGISLPSQPMIDGTVVEQPHSGLPRVGVWLMPDNSNAGELEDLLSGLVPSGDPIWPLAQSYVGDVFEQLPVRERPKRSKAEVHAWLAGKNGGLPMGLSVKAGIFNHGSPVAQRFLAWLRDVFI